MAEALQGEVYLDDAFFVLQEAHSFYFRTEKE